MRRKNSSQHIYSTIKDEIFQNCINPRDVLVVDVLAQRFNVSRTPVREALLSLCNEGLLESRHHVGFIVTPVDVQKVVQAYSLRAILEKESVRIAVQRIDDQTLAQLAMNITEPGKTHHRQFHIMLAEASGWGVLVEVLKTLIDISARAHALLTRKQTLLHEKSLESICGHQVIFDAVAARDADKAADAIEHHLNEAKDLVIRAITII